MAIGPNQVRIQGRGWARTLSAILTCVCDGLGVAEPVQAEFYKLLVYDEGSFFASHRDTEKAPGMFAMLVVVLPSTSTGGELLVRHKDREVRLDLHGPDPSEVAFAAFYADCVHEVLPITSGFRLALIYNLLRPGPGRLPEPPSYANQQAQLAALLQAWGADLSRSTMDGPEKLIVPLEHAYTSAELGFGALKGADAAAAAVLMAAAQAADCDLHLALISVQESGSAEYTGYGSSSAAGRSRRKTNSRRLRSSIAPLPCRHGGGPMDSPRCWVRFRLETTNSARPTRSTTWSLTRSTFMRRPATRALRSSEPTAGRRLCSGRASASLPFCSGRRGGHPSLSGRPDRALVEQRRGSHITAVA